MALNFKRLRFKLPPTMDNICLEVAYVNTPAIAPVLTDEQTLDEVIECLAKHLPIETQGACDQRTLFEILIHAASHIESIENTCKTLQNTPCGNDVRYHLEKYKDMQGLELQLNRAFQDRLPPRLVHSQQCVATDFNLLPYYGQPTPEEEPYIYRSQAKDGTCSFYAYATLYVMRKNKRVTIALTAVRAHDTTIAVLTRLFDQISPLNLKIKRLYLDRGYFCVPVIRWLQALDIPFEMPVIIRGKQGGTRQLLKGGKSYKTTYTLQSQVYGCVTCNVWIVCLYHKGERGKHGIQYLAYAVYKITLGLRSIHHDYRKRFGIETSYRLKNQCRIRTTTKNPVTRLLYVGIAFILLDLWIYLTWTYVSQPRKGGRLLFHDLFGLKRMLAFLSQAIERRRPPVTAVFLPDG
jgi:putative transposase